MKKTFSIFLALIMLLSVVPLSVADAAAELTYLSQIDKDTYGLEFDGTFTAAEAFEFAKDKVYNLNKSGITDRVYYRNSDNKINCIKLSYSQTQQKITYQQVGNITTHSAQEYTMEEILDAASQTVFNPDTTVFYYVIGWALAHFDVFTEVTSRTDGVEFINYYDTEQFLDNRGVGSRITIESILGPDKYDPNDAYIIVFKTGLNTYSILQYTGGQYSEYINEHDQHVLTDFEITDEKEIIDFIRKDLIELKRCNTLTFEPEDVHVYVAGFTTVNPARDFLTFTEFYDVDTLESEFDWDNAYSKEDIIYNIEHGSFEPDPNDVYAFVYKSVYEDKSLYGYMYLYNDSILEYSASNGDVISKYYEAYVSNKQNILTAISGDLEYEQELIESWQEELGIQVDDIHYMIPKRQRVPALSGKQIQYDDTFELTGTYDMHDMAIRLANEHKKDSAGSKKMEFWIFNNTVGGATVLMYFDGKVSLAKDSRYFGQLKESVDVEDLTGSMGFVDLCFASWYFYFRSEECLNGSYDDFKITVFGNVTPCTKVEGIEYTQINSMNEIRDIDFCDLGFNYSEDDIADATEEEIDALYDHITDVAKTIHSAYPDLMTSDIITFFIGKINDERFIVFTFNPADERGDYYYSVSDGPYVENGGYGLINDSFKAFALGEKKSEPQVHVHEFNVKAPRTDALAVAANCTQKAQYYYSCVCGEHNNVTFVDENGSIDENNHTEPNSDGKCDRCGKQLVENPQPRKISFIEKVKSFFNKIGDFFRRIFKF